MVINFERRLPRPADYAGRAVTVQLKKLRPVIRRRDAAQGIVEFALTMPVLLLVIFVIIEVAHIVLTFNAVTMASREASRYASGMMPVGIDGIPGFPHWQDCQGIRAAAKRVAVVPGLADRDILVFYDSGPGTPSSQVCNPNPIPSVNRGSRITVQVTSFYSPLVPIIQLAPIPITSSSSHTILTGIAVGN